MKPVLSIALALTFAAALFFSLFLYMVIGMGASERAANVFGTGVLVAVVLIVWWWGWVARQR